MLTPSEIDRKFAAMAGARKGDGVTPAHSASGAAVDMGPDHRCANCGTWHSSDYDERQAAALGHDEDQDDERRRVQHLADPVDGYQADAEVSKDWQYQQDGDGTTVDDPSGGEGGSELELRYAESTLGHPVIHGPTEAVGSPVNVPVPEGVFRPSDIRRAPVTDGQAADCPSVKGLMPPGMGLLDTELMRNLSNGGPMHYGGPEHSYEVGKAYRDAFTIGPDGITAPSGLVHETPEPRPMGHPPNPCSRPADNPNGRLHAALDPVSGHSAEVGKAYRDAVPGPADYPAPGKVVPPERPVISQGHAALSPAFDGPRTADKPTEPMSVTHRGPITDGHARPSPSNK